MPSRCSICSNSNLAAIDDLLDAGTNQKDVAVQFGVSRFALSRHCRHRQPESKPADPDVLEQQARTWRERADHLWITATADSDSRAQAQAIAAGLRSCELMAQRAKAVAANPAPVPVGETLLTIEAMDAIISRAMGDRRSGLIDKLFSANEATLNRVENILSESVN